MDEKISQENVNLKQEVEIYKNMYLKLFNSVTDALGVLDEKGDSAEVSDILKQAQLECEEIYISA